MSFEVAGAAAVLVFFLSAVVSIDCSFKDHEKRGDGYFSRGRYRDALAEYMIARKDDPSSTELLFKIGMTSARLGKISTARAYYDSLLSVDTSRKEWIINDLYRLGLKMLDEGDTASMKESFEMIMEIDSTYNLGESFYPLARAYRNSGQYGKAADAFVKALSFAPDSPAAMQSIFELATCYEALGRYKEAIARFEEYLEKSDGEKRDEAVWHIGNSAYRLARELYDEGNLDEASEYLSLMIEGGKPEVVLIEAWYLMGEIYRDRGEEEKALEAYEEVLKLDPTQTMTVTSRSLERIREIRYHK